MPAHGLDPALLSAALDTLPQGVLITDRDCRVVWQNAASRALTGGLPPSLREVIAAGMPWQGSTLCHSASGEVASIEATLSPLDDRHWMVTLREVAEEPLTSDLCRTIAENAVDVIWLHDLEQNRNLFVSPSVERFRGFTSDEVLEQAPEKMMTAEWWEQIRRAMAAVEAGDETARVQTNEFDLPRKDGSVVAFETITKLIPREKCKIKYLLCVIRDISQRKAAQQALREAEEKYRTIFSNALEGIYRTTIDGRPLAANPAAARMLGYESPEELLSFVSDVAAQFWTDSSERQRFLKLLDQQGTVRDFECVHRKKDGTSIWISLNSRLVSGPDGEPLYHEGFVEDITERKRMETALRKSEEKFAKVFLSSAALNSIHDVQDGGRILDVNEAFEHVTGYPREEVIGRTISELNWFPDSNTEGEIVRRLRGDGRIRNMEHQFRTRSGELRTVLLSAEKIELDGREYSLAARFDITERKQSEERMQSLATAIEQAGEQIVITELDGTIVYCNPAFEKTTGYSREQVLGKNPSLLKSGRQPVEFYSELWRTITSGSVWSGCFTNRRQDGSLYYEEATISPVRDNAGRTTGYVAVKRDVSERLQLENQLRQAQKLESVGRLAGGVAHDFNNLLTIINGYSEMILDKLEQQDPLRGYASEIRTAGQRAAGLTRQLLAFSRKQVIDVCELDLNSIVHDAERMLRRLIGEDIELVTEFDPELEHVMGDPDQLHQVIMNLVLNSRDAMPNGGRLVIETRNCDVGSPPVSNPETAPGLYVRMSVTDTGTGIAAETLESMFEPFFTTKEQGKGTGLGLSIVYGIVRQNGGWIEVSSEIGTGTTFRIYLPRVRPETLSARQPDPQQAVSGGGETVLLVEDQEEVRTLARTILRAQGYRVIDGANGAEAWVLAREYDGPIHLLLTDVVMPGMNGKELSERLHTKRPAMKVLFTSGYTADVIANRGILQPQVVYLPKPFTAETLVTKVREALASA
jgi:two-component system cell cycle sensor histidine kinase/response regulator CckA